MTVPQQRTSNICLGLLILFSLTAAAQANSPRVATLNDGRTVVYLKPPSNFFTPAPPDAGLVTIYSNLGTGNNIYNGIAGTGILGHFVPGQPFPEWIGNSFVPSDNRMVTEVQVGVTY
nr:hypothetical protein [Terriglobales bacterium]